MTAQVEMVQGDVGTALAAGIGVLCMVAALIGARNARHAPSANASRLTLAMVWWVQGVALALGALDVLDDQAVAWALLVTLSLSSLSLIAMSISSARHWSEMRCVMAPLLTLDHDQEDRAA